MAVASAAPSRQALASQTVSAMRKSSRAVSGKKWHINMCCENRHSVML